MFLRSIADFGTVAGSSETGHAETMSMVTRYLGRFLSQFASKKHINFVVFQLLYKINVMFAAMVNNCEREYTRHEDLSIKTPE
jgi:hypothetical protein